LAGENSNLAKEEKRCLTSIPIHAKINPVVKQADVMELVDMRDLGSRV